MRVVRCVLFFVTILLVASCQVGIPKYVMQPDKMEAFLYDYHMVQAMAGEYSSDDYKEKLYYSYIFKKHNIDKEQFDTAMQWYSRYPKHLRRIYENITARLEREVERLDNARGCDKEGVSLDFVFFGEENVNLWTSPTIRQFSSNSLNNRLLFSFKVPDDTTFVKGDSLSFSFVADFIAKDSVEQEAFASIRLDYENDSIFTKAVRVDSVGAYNLSAPRYFDSKLKSMNGFVYYVDNDTTAASRMLLRDISLMKIKP